MPVDAGVNCRPPPTPDATPRGSRAPGEPDDAWWFGFDCLHLWDYAPNAGWAFEDEGVYRNWAYVKDQCAQLAAQLASVTAVPA